MRNEQDEGEWAGVPVARAGVGCTSGSFPPVHDAAHLKASNLDATFRSAAADISAYYFSALPGVNALLELQRELAWAEEHWPNVDGGGCPFTGAYTRSAPPSITSTRQPGTRCATAVSTRP